MVFERLRRPSLPLEKPQTGSPGHATLSRAEPRSALRPALRDPANATISTAQFAPETHRLSRISTSPAHVIQAMFGNIVDKTTVVDAGSAKSYPLPENEQGQAPNQTLVTFVLREGDIAHITDILEHRAYEKELDWFPPVFRQWAPQSCAIEAARMVLASVSGVEQLVPRSDVKSAFEQFKAYDPYLGADFLKIPDVMNFIFKQEFLWRCRLDGPVKLTIDELEALARPNKPVIAIFKNPNHVVVVDAVAFDPPNRTIAYRDPADGAYVGMAEAGYNLRATGGYYVLK